MNRRPTPPDPAGAVAAEAFVRALYDDIAGPLFGYALRLTGDRGRAEEVVQETLVRAWRHAAELDLEPDALRGWLFTVARNLVTDLRRSDAARPSTVVDGFALSPRRPPTTSNEPSRAGRSPRP